MNSGHASPVCPWASLFTFLGLGLLNYKLRCRGKETGRKAGGWKVNQVYGQYSGHGWFDNIQTLLMFTQSKLHRVLRFPQGKRRGEMVYFGLLLHAFLFLNFPSLKLPLS